MIMYIVENGKLVRYERTGKCNMCGDCCGAKNTITYQIKSNFGNNTIEGKVKEVSEDDWSEYEGYTVFWAQRLWWYFRILKITDPPTSGRCSEQDPETFQCKVWKDFDEFPVICRYWPFNPKDLEQFPNCSFKFIKEETDEIMLAGDSQMDTVENPSE